MLTYRYTWQNGRRIVYEYECGRLGHSYRGEIKGDGVGVLLFKTDGGFNKYSTIPYRNKQINIYMMKPLDDSTPPIPPRKSKPTKPPPAQDPPDNSPYCGRQLKLI